MPVYFSLILRRYYCNTYIEILPIRPLRTRNITTKMSGTIELRLKGKVPPLPPTPMPPAPPPPTIQSMELRLKGKALLLPLTPLPPII